MVDDNVVVLALGRLPEHRASCCDLFLDIQASFIATFADACSHDLFQSQLHDGDAGDSIDESG